MANLLLINLPYSVSDREIRLWIESRGIEIKSIRVVRDLVAGVSPAFGVVELNGSIDIQEAIPILDGKKMRERTILAREAPANARQTRRPPPNSGTKLTSAS